LAGAGADVETGAAVCAETGNVAASPSNMESASEVFFIVILGGRLNEKRNSKDSQ
jgi:hypothetical protein